MNKTITMAQFFELKKALPVNAELIAYRSISWDYEVKTYKSREALARAIRKQETRARHWTDFNALVPLRDGEGY